MSLFIGSVVLYVISFTGKKQWYFIAMASILILISLWIVVLYNIEIITFSCDNRNVVLKTKHIFRKKYKKLEKDKIISVSLGIKGKTFNIFFFFLLL